MPAHKHKKHFGQHFLRPESGVIEHIMNFVTPTPHDTFIEIGPGQGVLTQPLLKSGATVHAIEIDTDLLPGLEALKTQYPNFSFQHTDALEVEYEALFSSYPNPPRLIGNLPYNVATPLLTRWLPLSRHLQDMHFMMQKEVIDRVCAQTGERHFSRLSVLTQHYCDTEHCFDIPPEAFAPPPNVDSSIVALYPHSEPKHPDISAATLSSWTQKIFQQPRKTLRNNLKKHIDEGTLEALGIDPTVRPQSLPYEKIITLIKGS